MWWYQPLDAVKLHCLDLCSFVQKPGMQKRFYYLIKIEFLGYRLHGWQQQPGLKTVERMLRRTLKYVLDERRFNMLGASRTDAMVSASGAAFELFLSDNPLEDPDAFLQEFNLNLPSDIRALEIEEVNSKFNVINDAVKKEYVYLFAFGEKSHPFCAPFLMTFYEDLDLEKMKMAASIFEGKHDFKHFCTRPNKQTIVQREILKCEITENDLISASFFPRKSYALHVHGEGFLRNQIRIMMGALVLVGKGELSLEDLIRSLDPKEQDLAPPSFVAPGSGLHLKEIIFNRKDI